MFLVAEGSSGTSLATSGWGPCTPAMTGSVCRPSQPRQRFMAFVASQSLEQSKYHVAGASAGASAVVVLPTDGGFLYLPSPESCREWASW